MDVKEAHFTERPQFIRRQKSRGRFAVGIRFERRAKEYLSHLALGRPDLELIDGPWLSFKDKSGKRWCQPDALVVDKAAKLAVIIEVKYQHDARAWWQLKWLYRPVLEAAMEGFRFGLVEVVHWHDPATVWPEAYDLTPHPFRVLHHDRVSVHLAGRRLIADPSRLQAVGISCG